MSDWQKRRRESASHRILNFNMGQTPQTVRHHALLLFLILSSFYWLFLSTCVIVYCLIFSLMKNRTINSAFFKFGSSYLWMCGTFNHCNFSRFKIFYLFFERLFTILFYQRVRLCGITTFTSKRVTVSVWPW